MVEPPIASSTRSAFSKALAVRMRSGVSFERARPTATVPVRSATRMRSAVTAGGDALPGTAMPSASARHAMVLAVPITEQVPTRGHQLVVHLRDLALVDLPGAIARPVAAAIGAGADALARGASR